MIKRILKKLFAMLGVFLVGAVSFQIGSQINPVVFTTMKPQIIHGSYIRSINVPSIGNHEIKIILDKFNKMGYTKIVSYEGWRPIDILEFPKSDKKNVTIGTAAVRIFDCQIYLKTSELYNSTMVEQVIIHEYLHCLGYDHTSDPIDLMFPSYNESSEENVRKYAEDAYKRLEEW